MFDLLAAATTGPATGEGLTSLTSPEAIVALLTLTLLEIVLGVDNIIVISIMSKKLPPPQSDKARLVGLSLAMFMRIALLLSITWVMGLTFALFNIPAFWTSTGGDVHGVSGRDLILLIGGAFLIYKATVEIHAKLEGQEHGAGGGKAASFASVIVTILLMDLVFSLDSVITAVGMVQVSPDHRWVGLTVMITAVVIAVVVMLFASGPIANFVEKHPTVKMLALSFLILIGVMLVAEGAHQHVPKGYIYFAMAFSLGVELLNMKLRKPGKAVHLHGGATTSPGDR
jgi:predicted tellurium resistance membrane protein TerC